MTTQILLFIIIPLLSFTLAIYIYNKFASYTLHREIKTATRNPETGIIQGAEALTLPGPKNSAVLLLHGYLGTRQDFNQLPAALKKQGHNIRLIRLPGHGTSPIDFAPITAQDLLTHAQNEYQQLRDTYKHVHLVGFSMGASLATILAATENPETLTLLAPCYAVTQKWHYLLPLETWQKIGRKLFPYIYRGTHFIQLNKRENIPHIPAYRTLPTSGIDTLMTLAKQASNPKLLEKIKAPLLIIHSSNDLASDPRASKTAFENMHNCPNKTYLSLKKSNHILLWDHDAEETSQNILNFLASK